MANSEDTEITLGTGKMLAIFFGLVALCAVFFGMGFSLGKSSAAPSGVGVTSVNSSASSTRPAAMKPSGSAASPDLSFYKTVGQKEPDTQLSAADTGAAQASPPSAPDPGCCAAFEWLLCASGGGQKGRRRAIAGRSIEEKAVRSFCDE